MIVIATAAADGMNKRLTVFAKDILNAKRPHPVGDPVRSRLRTQGN
jgi:hypothetical protein